jgi:hypothetical protein
MAQWIRACFSNASEGMHRLCVDRGGLPVGAGDTSACGPLHHRPFIPLNGARGCGRIGERVKHVKLGRDFEPEASGAPHSSSAHRPSRCARCCQKENAGSGVCVRAATRPGSSGAQPTAGPTRPALGSSSSWAGRRGTERWTPGKDTLDGSAFPGASSRAGPQHRFGRVQTRIRGNRRNTWNSPKDFAIMRTSRAGASSRGGAPHGKSLYLRCRVYRGPAVLEAVSLTVSATPPNDCLAMKIHHKARHRIQSPQRSPTGAHFSDRNIDARLPQLREQPQTETIKR